MPVVTISEHGGKPNWVWVPTPRGSGFNHKPKASSSTQPAVTTAARRRTAADSWSLVRMTSGPSEWTGLALGTAAAWPDDSTFRAA